MRPRCAKIGQDRTKMSQKRRKMSQDRLQDCTKICQDGAKLGQDAAKIAQDSAKSYNFDGFWLSLSIQKQMKNNTFSILSSICWDVGSTMRPRCAKIGQDRTKMNQEGRKMGQDRLQDGTKIG